MNDSQVLLERPAAKTGAPSDSPWIPSGSLNSPPPGSTSADLVAAESISIGEAFELWRSSLLQLRKDGGESVCRSMAKDVLPWIGHRTIGTLQRDEIAAVLQRIVERGSSRQAGCVLADIRQLLRWALRQGLIQDDPSLGLHKNDYAGDGQVRSRALSLDEVNELASKMNVAGLAPHIRTAIWLMLATGVRIGEIATARWQDINIDTRTWTIPAHLNHSGHAHAVALSDFVIRQLLSANGQRRSPTWVFPSRDESEPISPKALGKQIRDRQRGTQIRGRSAATTMLLLRGGAWTPLDLRRTTAVLMTHLGIPNAVIASCLDQQLRGPGAHESHRIDSEEACQDAFMRLGAFLEQIESGSHATQRLAASAVKTAGAD